MLVALVSDIPNDGLTDDEVRRILTTAKKIMVVGMSRNPEKPSGEVPLFLRSKGYEVIPVNPNASEISGLKTYPSVSSYPGRVDVVEVFRPSASLPPLMKELVDFGRFDVLWLQEGIYDPSVKLLKGKIVAWNRCMMKEYKRLMNKTPF